VEEDVRGVTRPQTVALGLGLVVIFAVAGVTGIGGEIALSSEAQAAIIGGALGILGAILGLFAERWVRRWGKVRCERIHMDVRWRASPDGSELTQEEVARLEDFGSVEAQVDCALKFYNDKEVNIGLSRLRIVFVAEDGEIAQLEPSDTQRGVQTVNIVSRMWSKAKVSGVIRGGSSRLVRDYHTIEVRGAFPDHSLYRDTLVREVGR
jgi:hypothetical protein